MAMLGDPLEDEMGSLLPPAAVAMFRVMLDLLADLYGRIAELDREIARRAREDEPARRLMTIPGIGPITATALIALAPEAETFAKGRDFAAWPQGASTDGTRPRMGLSKPEPLFLVRRCHRRSSIIGVSWR
ncbi:transposase [Methylobacterium sp. 10]|uniref:transposase n=1 Tax=Methylobacterium sp. 10 TaxID=1101191 RepID=UPI0004B30CAE|nr:transposase [Methylobacterium sp. 10]